MQLVRSEWDGGSPRRNAEIKGLKHAPKIGAASEICESKNGPDRDQRRNATLRAGTTGRSGVVLSGRVLATWRGLRSPPKALAPAQAQRRAGPCLDAKPRKWPDAEVSTCTHCRRNCRVDRGVRDRIGSRPHPRRVHYLASGGFRLPLLCASERDEAKTRVPLEEQLSLKKVFCSADLLWNRRAAKLAAKSTHGTGRTPEMPSLRGLSDLGASSGRQRQAHVPVL